MIENHKKLIAILQKKNGWTTTEDLSAFLNVSSRTVKTYIKTINQEFQSIILTSSQGVMLSKDVSIESYLSTDDATPQAQDERIRFMLKDLLDLSENESISIYDLADPLYVSESTVRRDLAKASDFCSQYNLIISSDHENLSIQGLESSKRKLLNELYRNECSESELTLDSMQKMFPSYDLPWVKATILEICRKYNYLINGYAMNNLVLDTVIEIDRISNSFEFNEACGINLRNYHEELIADDIIRAFEKQYRIHYSNAERNAFTVLLFSHLLRVDFQKISKEDLIQIVGKETYQLAIDVLNEANDSFLQMQDNDFLIRFTLHLSNLLMRARTNYIDQNELTNTIKTSCPLLFETAVNISHIINKKTGYLINDDEIAYIALHLGCLMGSKSNQRIPCAVILPEYYNLRELFIHKFIGKFGDDLDIDVYESPDKLSVEHYLVFISVDRCNRLPRDRTLYITGLTNASEFSRISDFLQEVKDREHVERLTNQIINVTNERFFYVDPPVSTRLDIIRFMTKDLISSGIVGYEYEEDVIQRENMSSTAFNRIAAPHSIKLNANKTTISVAIFNKPVSWGNKAINACFLLAINQNDKAVFNSLFDNFIPLFLEEENLLRFLKCRNYKQFIEIAPHLK